MKKIDIGGKEYLAEMISQVDSDEVQEVNSIKFRQRTTKLMLMANTDSADEFDKVTEERINRICGEYKDALGRLIDQPCEPITVDDIVKFCAENGMRPSYYKCNNDTCEANEFLPEEGFTLCPLCIEKLTPRFGELNE